MGRSVEASSDCVCPEVEDSGSGPVREKKLSTHYNVLRAVSMRVRIAAARRSVYKENCTRQ